MKEHICPRNPQHVGFKMVMQAEDSPHHAALLCVECEQHIKWASQKEVLAYYNSGGASLPEGAESIECPACPITRLPCMETECAWWWVVGGGVGDCLVMRIGKMMSMPLVVIDSDRIEKP